VKLLDRFCIRNFKAFRKADIKIKPITILVGPNNSGKSSLIQAINLVQQTLLKNPNNYMINVGSSNSQGEQMIDAGSFSEIISHSAQDKKITFELYFSEKHIKFSLKENGDTDVYVSDFLYNSCDLQYSLENLSLDDYNKKDSSLKNIDKFHIELDKYFKYSNIAKLNTDSKINREGFFFYITSIAPIGSSLQNFFQEQLSAQMEEEIPESELIKKATFDTLIKDMVESLENYRKISTNSYNSFQKIKKDLSNIGYIGPVRQLAERSYSIGSYKDMGFGGEHATQILAMNRELRTKVEQCFKKMSIAENLQIDIRNEKQRSFEFKIKTACSDRGVNFKDVGCGTSQILPVIIQSLMAKEESLVMLEQPEVHLHPKTQAELADFFVNIASRNNRFLIETHSDYFIERLRYHVATGAFRSEDVLIYYIESDPIKKCSIPIKIEINSKGQYNDLPQGYITNFRLGETKRMTGVLLKNLNEENKPEKKQEKGEHAP
jgi:predicted ATPase